MSGLSANQLEYIILGCSILYMIIAFYEYRTRKTWKGELLRLALTAIPFIETKLRKMREWAKRRG